MSRAPAQPLLVKVYGRDATDARLAARWWHTLLYRDEATPGATRLQMVEHEALLTLLAQRAGVRVDERRRRGRERRRRDPGRRGAPARRWRSAPRSTTRCSSRPGPPSPRCRPPASPTASSRSSTSRATRELRSSRSSAAGTVAATDAQLALDVAVLLTSQALLVGPERAVDAAIAGLGADRTAAAQPYLQRAALPRSLRGDKGLKALIAALQTTITDRTGTEPPPPAEIVRVRPRDLLQTGFILFAAYVLLSTLVNLDWHTVWSTWSNATWAWVVIGLVVCQSTSVADAGTALSTVRTRLPLVPLVHLQYAVKTVGLAISATLGRVALYTTFFRRYGEGPSVAVTATGLDSMAASVANVVVVGISLLLAKNLPDLDLSGPDNLDRIIALLVVVLALSALAVALVPEAPHAGAADGAQPARARCRSSPRAPPAPWVSSAPTCCR